MAPQTELANVYRLRVFAEVAQNLSFSRAAKNLYLTQPAVSNHIKQLEKIVGGALFDQRTRGLQLTETGHAVYDYAQKMLALAEEMESSVMGIKGSVAGHISVESDGLWEQFLPDLLADFQMANPKVVVTLRFSSPRGVAEAVIENRAGLGFVNARPRNARLEELPVASFASRLLVIMALGHPLAGERSVRIAGLEEYPFVYYPPAQPGNVIGHFERLGIRPQYALEIASLEGVKRAVARGAGISVLHEAALRYEERIGRLALVPLDAPPVEWSLLAVRKKTRTLSTAERAVLTYVTAHFAACAEAGSR